MRMMSRTPDLRTGYTSPQKCTTMVLPIVSAKIPMRQWLFAMMMMIATVVGIILVICWSHSLAFSVATSSTLLRHVTTSSSLLFMKKSTVQDECPCRSNSTHVVWYTTSTTTTTTAASTHRSIQRHQVENHNNDDRSSGTSSTSTNHPHPSTGSTGISPTSAGCTWQTIHEAKMEAYHYLRGNVMSFDVPFMATMGFHDDDHNEDDTDGLSNGMIGPVIDLAFDAKINFPYTDLLPQSIFYEYVLNYANVNENRNNIRPYLNQYLIQPLFFPNSTSSDSPSTAESPAVPLLPAQSNHTMVDAIHLINTNMWCLLAPSRHADCIRFVSGQTPVIFDPMSVLTFGYGSCTGVSILLVQALRSAGIPARLAGTPAWNQNVQHGNHNWVEVWFPPPSSSSSAAAVPRWWRTRFPENPTMDTDANDHNGVWLFLEGGPAMSTLDRLDDDWDPCIHFLCEAERQINGTQYFAATLSSDHDDGTYFPLAWDVSNQAVPAVNRTLFYHTICAQCRK